MVYRVKLSPRLAYLASALAIGIVASGFGLQGCSQHDESVGRLEAPVQLAYIGSTETATGKGAHLVRAWSSGRKAKSVGAIRPNGEEWPVSAREATCGATFISDRHAVTAAHCVDQLNLPNVYVSSVNPGSPFRIQQINASAVSTQEYLDQAAVSGTWPNYNRADTLTAAEGYSVTNLTCYVRARCESETYSDGSPGLGRENCPAGFGASSVDIALVYCPGRSTAGSNWVNVASSDSGSGDAEAWWLHEVVNLSINQETHPAGMPAYNYQQYYLLGTNQPYNWDENYHYNNELQDHQMLQLVSYRDVNQQNYFRTGHSGNYTRTNIPACHGTSGSGVFAASAWNAADPQLLGPVVYGDAFVGTHLCAQMDLDPGSNTMSQYARQSFTKILEQTSWVTGDRL